MGSDVGEYYRSDVVDTQLRVDTCMTEKWVHRRKVSDFSNLSNISEAKKTGMEEESITTRDNRLKTLDDEETLMLVTNRSDDDEGKCYNDEETKETSVREIDMFEKLETGEVSVTESQEVFGKVPAEKSKDSEESV